MQTDQFSRQAHSEKTSSISEELVIVDGVLLLQQWHSQTARTAHISTTDLQAWRLLLATKATTWLQANQKEWQPFWAPDPSATTTTESGPVPTTANEWLEAILNKPSKWMDHYATAGLARAIGFDILVFEPKDTNTWALTARQPAHPGIHSQPLVLLLQKDHFTTIHGKATEEYNHMTPPPGPCRFHGSGNEPDSPVSSSWCKPPPSLAPTSSSWCKPPVLLPRQQQQHYCTSPRDTKPLDQPLTYLAAADNYTLQPPP